MGCPFLKAVLGAGLFLKRGDSGCACLFSFFGFRGSTVGSVFFVMTLP
jgi:hypothetical protein